MADTLPSPLPPAQRLIVCLDGTWNTADSCTSIYHLSNLVVETNPGDPAPLTGDCPQRVYYATGVGTHIFDNITGGAFGAGLSDNVREAYDWLVERYSDGDGVTFGPDHIYIFGFSRGAFTARSLVGLISKCGLLRRGAPVPVSELWEGYRILGEYPHEHTGGSDPKPGPPTVNIQQRKFERPPRYFRAIWELDNATELNATELLLQQWSRRVPIQCVGIYDTVGSMGSEALGLPWIRDEKSRFHDTNLSRIVVNGFHGQAIDEHRANFVNVPWRGDPANPTLLGGTTRWVQTTYDPLAGTAKPGPVWTGTLEQMWFLGAHSNVGGGYEDDILAVYALHWLVQRTKNLGLRYKAGAVELLDRKVAELDAADFSLRAVPPPEPTMLADEPIIRDSYAEFGGFFWQHLVRAKRNYRRIAPPEQVDDGEEQLLSINEHVHPSVYRLLARDARRPGATFRFPPNLWEFLGRNPRDARQFLAELNLASPGGSGPLTPAEEHALAKFKPSHAYVDGPCFKFIAFLLLWLGLVGLCGYSVAHWLLSTPASCQPSNLGIACWAGLASMLFAWLVDYVESRANFGYALGAESKENAQEWRWNLILRLRLFCLALAGGGLLIALFHILRGLLWLWHLMLQSPARLADGWTLLILGGALVAATLARWATARPMKKANLGSMTALQAQDTPKGIFNLLRAWFGASGAAGLSAVKECLLLDLFLFIPAYAITIFLGTWLELSTFRLAAAPGAPTPPEGLWSCGWPFWIAVTIAGLCALLDCLEDFMHLSYLRLFSNPAASDDASKTPSPRAVGFGRFCTLTKDLLVTLGFILTLHATAWYLWKFGLALWSTRHGWAVAILLAIIPLCLVFNAIKTAWRTNHPPA